MAKSKPRIGDKSANQGRDEKGRFTRGNASTGGRPKLPEELKQAFREAAPEALAVLREILADKNARPADRIRCAEVILERGYGKPAQEVSLSTQEGGASEVGIIMLPAVAPDAKEAVREDE